MNNVYHLPGLLPPSLPRILVPVPSADHIPLLLLIGCLSKVCISIEQSYLPPTDITEKKIYCSCDAIPIDLQGLKDILSHFNTSHAAHLRMNMKLKSFSKSYVWHYHLSSQLFQPSSPRVILIVTLLTRVSILILVSPPTVVVANIPVATDSWRWRGCEAESDSLRWTMSTIVTNPPHAGKRGDKST